MRLLVSVASAAEARAALAGGADLIDAKDPHRGALGAVSPFVLHAISAAVAGRRPLSAALGDAWDSGTLRRASAAAPLGCRYVKIGFRGVGAQDMLRQATATRNATTARVMLVALADWRRVEAPQPERVLDAAAAAGARGLLLDTALKDARLLDLLSPDAVSAWVAAVHARGLLAALAGSLGSGDLRALATCEADIVGVRGAACEGGRTGRISTRRVAELSALARGATLRRHGALVHDGA